MIGIGDDVIISGKVDGWETTYLTDTGRRITTYDVILRSGNHIRVQESDIKSYHPYQPIPESDERRGQ